MQFHWTSQTYEPVRCAVRDACCVRTGMAPPIYYVVLMTDLDATRFTGMGPSHDVALRRADVEMRTHLKRVAWVCVELRASLRAS
jgi:hypothetical protein